MRQRGRILASVIVPCRNEIKHIGRFLDCISRQELRGFEIEVLIADGMSDDGSRKVLEDRNPTVRVIDNPEMIVSTGLNRAIREARGEIIIRMDVHTEYAPDYIMRCLEVLRETKADNVGGPALTRANGFLPQAIALAYHSSFACGGARFHDPEYEGLVDTVTYGCWRRCTFDRIGLFDESLGRNQDDELNFRLVRAGGTIWQSPRIVSWYRPRATLTALFRQYFQYGFWKVAVIRKHQIPASWRHLVPGSFVLAGAALSTCALFTVVVGPARLKYASLLLWVAFVALYFGSCLGASLLSARRSGWRFLLILPVVFATYHLSYGLGFLLGLIHRPGRNRRSKPLPRIVIEITR